MHTITYTPTGETVETSLTQVTRIEFEEKGKTLVAYTDHGGKHRESIPTDRVRQID